MPIQLFTKFDFLICIFMLGGSVSVIIAFLIRCVYFGNLMIIKHTAPSSSLDYIVSSSYLRQE